MVNRKYRVLSPVSHDGKLYSIGSAIFLTDAEAAPLVGYGTVIVDPNVIVDSDSDVFYLLTDAVATGAGQSVSVPKNSGDIAFMLSGNVNVGIGSAIVDVEVSNVGLGWEVAFTLTIDLSTINKSVGYSCSIEPWRMARSNVRSIAGSAAKLSMTMGL